MPSTHVLFFVCLKIFSMVLWSFAAVGDCVHILFRCYHGGVLNGLNLIHFHKAVYLKTKVVTPYLEENQTMSLYSIA